MTSIILAHSFPPPPAMTNTETQRLNCILERLSLRISHYRPLILPHFVDFDRNREGSVSSKQFGRVMTIVKSELSIEELALMARAFYAPDTDSRVDYRAFLARVDNLTIKSHTKQDSKEYAMMANNNTFKEQSRTSAEAQREERLESKDADAIVTDIQQRLSMKRQELYDVFNDFDSLRHRSVTQAQFRRCLTTAGLLLTETELNTLAERFASCKVPNEVAYDQFQLAVLSSTVPHHPESHRSSTTTVYNPFKGRTDKNFFIVKCTKVDEMLRRLAYVSFTRRVLIKPAFAAHDKHAAGYVTRAAFTAVLSSLFPTEKLDVPQQEQLMAQFAQNEYGVSYFDFCREIAELEAEFEESVTQVDSKTSTQNPIRDVKNVYNSKISGSGTVMSQPIVAFDALMQSLRDTLSTWRLHIDTAFDDYDRLRRGSVAKPIFYRCLSSCGLVVRPEEVEVLADHYAVVATDRDGHVDYRAFLSDLSSIQKQ